MGTKSGTTCDERGKCTCKTGYTGDKCNQCDAKYYQATEESSCEGK